MVSVVVLTDISVVVTVLVTVEVTGGLVTVVGGA